jgi:alkylation response protein AidB-like acyl-CoA dehydrogenase
MTKNERGEALTTVGQHGGDLGAEVEAWLRAELPAAWVQAIDRDDARALAQARQAVDVGDWWRRLGKTGYFVPTWPKEYGGHDADVAQARRVRAVLAKYKVPRPLSHASFHAASAILKWGSDSQKARFLRPISEQTEIWCQLLSEPGAGSDLASLATRAVPDGDQWRVTGEKVWTSFAHLSRWGLVACRTDPDAAKRDGITMFVLDMHGEGVTVRPLVQMTGDAEFNQVFIDAAVIPDEHRLGPVGAGWRVIRDVLGGERGSNSGAGTAVHPVVVGRSLKSLMAKYPKVDDPILRDRLVQVYIDERVLELTNRRMAEIRGRSQEMGSFAAVTKVFRDEHTKRLHDLAVDLAGSAGVAWSPDDDWNDKTSWAFLRSRAASIGGGTVEMMRNIVGERVLGLPKEPDLYAGRSWEETPR